MWKLGCAFEGFCLKFSEVEPILQNSNRVWWRKVLHVARTKTIKKWGLNTSENFMNLRADDFFAERCGNNIHTMRIKYYQKYIHGNMYNVFKR